LNTKRRPKLSPTETTERRYSAGEARRMFHAALMEGRSRSSGQALFLATGVNVGEAATRDNVVDAVIGLANGDGQPEILVEESERDVARKMLSAAAEGQAELLAWIDGNARDRSGVVMAPGFGVSKDESHVRETGFECGLIWRLEGPPEPEPWVCFAAFVIADGTHAGGPTSIGHCGWIECRRFFRVVIEGKGKPARLYCPGTNHREKGQPSSTARVKAWRKHPRQPAKGK